MRTYRAAWVGPDLLAGLALAAVLIPQGMAFAQIAGLPVVYGLYSTVIALIAYAIFGPSRILVVGPDSTVAPLVAAAVVPMAAGDPKQLVALAGMLALLSGGVLLVASIARLGFVSDLLSQPVRIGFFNGVALVIALGQLARVFGFTNAGEGLLGQIEGFVSGVTDMQAAALVIGVSVCAFVLACKRWWPRVPGVLIAVVGATLAVSVWNLAIPVVGPLPQGVPVPTFPVVSWQAVWQLLPAALGIALVSFADTTVLSRSLAARRGETVDQNREMSSLGFVNVANGLFQGFAISSSASRTAVAETSGAKTQLAGFVASVTMLGLLAFAPTLLRDLPQAALGGIVILAAITLVDVKGVRRLWRVRRSEFWLSMATFAGVALFGVLPGVAIAVVLSLLNVLRKVWRPHDAVLGRVDEVKGYHDIERYPRAKLIPGLLLYRFDAPLFFANASRFADNVWDLVEHPPDDLPVKWVALSAEPMTDVDTTAADMLHELSDDLAARGIELVFAELKDPVREQLVRYGLDDDIAARYFPTIGTAVAAYLATTGIDWTDWEEEPTPPS